MLHVCGREAGEVADGLEQDGCRCLQARLAQR